MAKVNPTTGEPMSDAPELDDDLRGGKKLGDPALDEASANGTGAGSSGAEYNTTTPLLPGEKGSER